MDRHRFLAIVGSLRRSKGRTAAAILATMVIIAIADVWTDPKLDLFPLYFPPIFLVSLVFGRRWTLFVAASSSFLILGAQSLEHTIFPSRNVSHSDLENVLIVLSNLLSGLAFGLIFEYMEKSVDYEVFIHNILRHLPYGVITVGPAGLVTHFNPAGGRILGVAVSDVVGRPLHQVNGTLFARGDGFPDVVDALHQGAQTIERTLPGGEEEVQTLLDTFAPMQNSDGSVSCIHVFHDVSREKGLEKARDAMVAVLSHDMRSSLTIIKGYGGLLTRSDLTPQDRLEFAAAISDSVRSLILMLDDVVEDVRQRDGEVAFHFEVFDLAELLGDVERLFVTYAHTQGFVFEVKAEKGCMVNADREKLRQVLNNLVSNALKYCTPGGRITVAAVLEGELVHVAVSDTGPGIPESFLPRLFDRFTQADSRKQGVGLGLFIASRIVRRHQSRLEVETRMGEGTCFTFSLGRVNTVASEESAL